MGLLLLDCANQDRIAFYDVLFLERWQFMSKRQKRRNRVYKSILDNPFNGISFLSNNQEASDLYSAWQSQIVNQFANPDFDAIEVTS